MITRTTRYGNVYDVPAGKGISEDEYIELIHSFIDIVKEKGLTIRQAQKLFIDCSDCVLEENLK